MMARPKSFTRWANETSARSNHDRSTMRQSTISAYIDMPLALAAADLVIAKSGASTIAEVTCAGVPAILIPYPHAYASHQKLNADQVAAGGAAILCEEHSASSEALADTVLACVARAASWRQWPRPAALWAGLRLPAGGRSSAESRRGKS